MASKRNLQDFKVKHDPETIIARLESELAEARSLQRIEDSIAAIIGTAAEHVRKANPPDWILKPAKAAKSHGIPTLLISDWHWGEFVDPQQVNGVNEFDLAIARRRLKHTFSTAVQLCEILDPQMRYPGVVVALAGDLVSGNLHDELTATNELNIMPIVLDVVANLYSAIKLMADRFGKVYVPCVSGNHGRDTKRTWAKDRNATSFDWLICQFLAVRFADDARVQFHIPYSADAYFRILNTRYVMTHGDQFKSGDSIIGPLGPLARGRQKKLARDAASGREWDVLLAGHFHTYMQLPTFIVNGSGKGTDEWSMAQNFGVEPPQQALWITHNDHGITWRMPVLCDETKARDKAQPWVSG